MHDYNTDNSKLIYLLHDTTNYDKYYSKARDCVYI